MIHSAFARMFGFALACLPLASCVEPEDATPDGSGGAGGAATGSTATGETGGGPGEGGVLWSPCPLYLDQPDGPQAECATIDVPLRWSEPEGKTIGIFVLRLPGTAKTIRGQLWLLEGGPGASGADFDSWMERFGELDPSLDLYAVDHRGVGRSARLACPAQEALASDWGHSVSPDEAAPCLAAVEATWGNDLAEFTTTAAARDLVRVIDVAKQPGQDVFVYGVSYGTYWAHRYLQVETAQAKAVILDSIAPPTVDFVSYDSDFDAVAQDFIGLCAADALCSSKLGADPWAALVDLSDALSAGHCQELTAPWGLDASTVRVVLASLLMNPVTRTYFPALVYRLARCEAADVAAIDQLLTVIFGGPQTTSYYDELSSDALFYNVALSELWPNAAAHPTLQQIDDSEAALHVTTGLTPRVAAVQDVWPAYADDEFVGAWARTDTPLLLMNGDLDPLTPIWLAQQAADHFTAPQQQYFTIPRAAHAVTSLTPVAQRGDTPCGLTILVDFLAQPTAATNSRCIAAIPEETFTGEANLNLYLLGTVDLWENGGAANVLDPALEPALDRSLRATRRWLLGRGLSLRY